MTVTEATTRTLDAPSATLTYDVRCGSSADEVPLFPIAFAAKLHHVLDER